MIEIITMLIVFGSIIAIVAIVSWFSYKDEELKAKLRLAEMEAGYAPGTYSKISRKDLKRAKKLNKNRPLWEADEEERAKMSEAQEREELLKGIDNLKARLDNIDTIMNHKKKEGGDD